MKPEKTALPSLLNPATGRAAGAVLLAAAILTVVAMAHHPSGHDATGAGTVMTLGGLIHATMIIVLAATVWGLTIFSARRGFGGLTLAGLLAYGTSFVGHLNAAMINGFIVPAVAAAVDHAAAHDLFTALWLANQAMAQLGVYAATAAFLFWSSVLLQTRTMSNIVLGVLGLAVAVGPSMALFSGAIKLDVDGALIVYGTHAVWTGSVGLQMLRRAL